jgi:hypothetical protein
MNELFFIPLIGMLSVVSTIISSKGGLYDKRFKWYKRLTKRGYVVSSLGIVLVGISVWQYLATKRNNEQKEGIQIQEKRRSDSIIANEIQKGVELNRKQLFDDLSEAMAGQNLKLDTVTNSIKSLRDSTITVIYNSPRENPIIIVRGNGITHQQVKDTIIFELVITSTQAAAKILFINYLCELNYSDGTKDWTKISPFLKRKFIAPKEQPFSRKFYVQATKEVKFVKIILMGKYSDEGGYSRKTMLDVYEYDLSTKQTSFMLEDKKSNFLREYNIVEDKDK